MLAGCCHRTQDRPNSRPGTTSLQAGLEHVSTISVGETQSHRPHCSAEHQSLAQVSLSNPAVAASCRQYDELCRSSPLCIAGWQGRWAANSPPAGAADPFQRMVTAGQSVGAARTRQDEVLLALTTRKECTCLETKMAQNLKAAARQYGPATPHTRLSPSCCPSRLPETPPADKLRLSCRQLAARREAAAPRRGLRGCRPVRSRRLHTCHWHWRMRQVLSGTAICS